MSEVWSTFHIYQNKDGSCRIEFATNDDNDDGVPDGEVARSTYHTTSLEKAFKVTGKTRVGFFGHKVAVFLDDILVRQE